MKLLHWVLTKETKEMMKEERKVLFVGSRENVPDDVLNLIDSAEEKTKDFTEGILAICFNYGGQQEIVDAVNAVNSAGGEVTVDSISDHLYKPEIPPLDLIVRTSGEQRISNYMLWRAAYAELAFTDTLWPDFSVEEIGKIIEDFESRHRRFGE